MEFLSSICGTIGEFVVGSIKRRYSDLKNYNNNIVDLERQLESLTDMEDDVYGAIERATRNSEAILTFVQRWIARVDGVKLDATKFLEENVTTKKRCFKGWFPDLKTHYRLSREVLKKLRAIQKLLEERATFADGVSRPAPRPGMESVSSSDIVLFQTTSSALEKVMDALKDDCTRFVGIYGMGGVGKTTLVKEIGRKSKEDGLFDDVAMAVVAQTVNMERIQKEIAEFLGLKLEEESEMIRANLLRNRLKSKEKILVILDDLWSNIDLTKIGIPSVEEHRGCKVVITTRRQQVCSSMGTGDRATSIVHLDVLTEQESWDLFKMQVGDIIEFPTVKIVAKKIVQEVGGLPIALLTVGKALRDKDEEEWKGAAQELQRSNPTNIEEMEEQVFKCIKFSYDYLKDEEAKSCFLLCSLFPEDDDIPIEDLVRYGLGLDIFKKADKIHEVRRRVRTIIRNLVASSLLVASKRDDVYVKMHDIVRDFARKFTSDKYISNAGEGLEEWPNEVTMGIYNGVGISVMGNEILNYPDAWECPNLKILLMQGNWLEQQMPERVCKGMKELRVLHQSNYFFHRDLEPFFRYWTNLCTLIIEGNPVIPDCPVIRNIDALGELKMLEVLSFRNCTFVFGEPLDVLRNLKNLRLLDLRGCTNCSSLFNYTTVEQATLRRLEELRMTECMSYEDDQFNFAKLTCFPRLTVLELYTDDIRCIPENFVFPKLDHFKIVVGYDTGSAFFFGDLPEDYNSLWISGLVGTAPNLYDPWRNCLVRLLSSVNFLGLSDFEGLGSIFPNVLVTEDSLTAVNWLEVRKCHELEYFINAEEESQVRNREIQHGQLNCFSDMETLFLEQLNNFKGICYGERLLLDMPCSFLKLVILFIDNCPRMSNIGVSFKLLQKMKRLFYLAIESCATLEYLFDLQEDDVVVEEKVLGNLTELSLNKLPCLEHLWKGSTELLSLHSLQSVSITSCNKLRILFQWSVAQSLVQLRRLRVGDCDELEGICADESGKETVVDGVMFPQLKELRLFGLPKLIGFYVSNTPLNGTPMLEEISMGGTKMPVNGRNLNTLIEDNKELLL